MKIQWKKFIPSIVLPLAVGGVSAWLTRDAMAQFAALNKPPLSPPGWLFGVVWTILYVLMGIADYLVRVEENAPQKQRKSARRVYLIQLAFNFLWSIIFFNFSAYLAAFVWLVALWALIIITINRFCAVRKLAGDLLLPYWLWVTFAGYLNFSIWLLN